jgi:hypothetical protein
MYDLVLPPVVTFSVIAALAIIIAAQAYFDARRMKARLRAQSIRLGKMTGMLLEVVTATLKSETEREVSRAIDFTYNTLRDIGFDKLAKGDVTFGVARRHHDPLDPLSPFDPLAPFSMDDLKEALRPKDGSKVAMFVDSQGGAHLFEEPVKNTDDEGAGLGGKGSRPYHTATADFAPRDPRAPRAG